MSGDIAFDVDYVRMCYGSDPVVARVCDAIGAQRAALVLCRGYATAALEGPGAAPLGLVNALAHVEWAARQALAGVVAA